MSKDPKSKSTRLWPFRITCSAFRIGQHHRLLVTLELQLTLMNPLFFKELNTYFDPSRARLNLGGGGQVSIVAGVGIAVGFFLAYRPRKDQGGADACAALTNTRAMQAVLWLALRYSTLIIRLIRDSGIVLITRIAGLLLSAIAVQLIADSVTGFVRSRS